MFAFEELLNGSILIRNDSRVRCSNWEYDRGTHTNTLTNQFDLVCDRIWLRAASQSVYMVGLMVGNFFYAHLSDWYGRKRALAFMVPVPIVAGVMTAFSSSFLMLNIGRFISSLGIGGIQNTTFTFVMEVLSARHRALGSLISSGGWTTGLLTLVALAWFIRDWFHMQLVISLAYLLLALNWMFMSESPRWLLATSKYQEAERVLADAIKKNKIKDVQPEDIIKDFKGKPSQENTSKKPTFIELFRVSCIRWTTVNMCTMSILGTLLYYNLTYSSILLGGNPYVSFALMAAMEYPVRLISVLFINYIRRRPSYVILYAFSALCSVDVLLQIKEDILDRISCTTTRAVLALDIKGAFDNVSHTLVFENLASTGCGPRMYDYVRDFLSNWMATIGIESIRTSTIPIPSKGNRQGSVLSPTFGRQDFLEEVIETVQNYLEAGNLQRAPDKSQLLLLRAGKPIPEEEEGGHPPHRDGGAKYTVDRLVKTTTQVMRMVRRITSHRHGLEESDLIRLTQPLVVSHIACANPYLNLLSRGKGKMDVIIRKGY
ncbi:organic cation transporter protein [Ixodes scapularis]